jgi:hypothetical protein
MPPVKVGPVTAMAVILLVLSIEMPPAIVPASCTLPLTVLPVLIEMPFGSMTPVVELTMLPLTVAL